MFELAITAIVMSQPSAEGVRAFEASAAIYRDTPALVDQMTYTVEMPGAEPHHGGMDITLGDAETQVDVGGLILLSRGDSFYFASARDDGPYIETTSDGGFVASMARAMGPTMRQPGPPHVYMRDGATTEQSLAAFGFGVVTGPDIVGLSEGEFEGNAVTVIEINLDNGEMELYIDPATRLFIGGSLVGTPPGGGSGKIKATLWFSPEIVEPEHASVAFDTSGRPRVESVSALMDAGPEIGQEVSDLAFENSSGKPFNLSDIKSPIVVLDFWATWCGNCMMTLPVLDEIAAWAAEQELPVEFLAVNARENLTGDARLAAMAEWWGAINLDLDWVSDIDNAAADELRASSFPMMVVLDADRRVIYAHSGFDPELEMHLKELLREVADD